VTDAQLAARVDRLERASRRERVLALGVLVLALATAQAPAPLSSPRVVRDAAGGSTTLSASGIVVRAGTTVRTAVGFDKDRNPSIDLTDSTGALRESMYLLADRPVLRLFDRAGKRRAEMFLASDTENGEFVIRDAADVTRLAAFVGSKGLPELALYGTDGSARAYASTDDDSPYLVMKDAAGASRVVIGGYTSGTMGMDVRDAAGTALFSKP